MTRPAIPDATALTPPPMGRNLISGRLRILGLLVTTAIVVSMSVLAAPPALAAKVTPSASLSISATSIKQGKSVTFTAKVRDGAARQKVVLQKLKSGNWKKVSTAKLPKKGDIKKVKFKLRQATAGAFIYRVKVKAKGKATATVSARKTVVVKENASKKGTTPTNPIKAGTYFTLGSWGFKFGATNPNAWSLIAAENMFNDPPERGWSFVMVPVTFTRLTGDPERPLFDTDWRYIGSDNRAYSNWEGSQSCGVLPGSVSDIDDMYPDSRATGNICAVVPTKAVAGGVWRIESDIWNEYRYVR